MEELKNEKVTKEKIETNFITYLESKILETQKEEQKLIHQERKDEANLFKIKNNIYEIAKTLFLSGKKEKQKNSLSDLEQDLDVVDSCNKFLDKMNKVPINWRISLEKAKKYQDAEKQLIEETKLSTAEEIIVIFKRMSNL